MITIRIFICILITLFSLYLSSDYIMYFMPKKEDVYVLDGILNIWASISVILIGTFFSIYYICLIVGYEIPGIRFNQIALVLVFILSPISSFIIKYAFEVKTVNYVECKELREISSRYSSRTYAISPEVCSLLKN